MSTWRTPKGASASTTALTMAGGPGDAAGLARALGAERVARRGRRGLVEDRDGHVGGAGHGVVHQRPAQELAVGVVDDLLQERLAHALAEAAVELPLPEERVDDGAAVVHPEKALEADPPRLALDARHRHAAAEAPHLPRGLEEDRGVEPRRIAGRQRLALVGGVGHALPRDPALGPAADLES